MATTTPIDAKKKLEAVELSRGFHPVQCALSKARAMAWTLEQLGAPDGMTSLANAVEDDGDTRRPEETREWLHTVVADALRSALDEAEAAFKVFAEQKPVSRPLA